MRMRVLIVLCLTGMFVVNLCGQQHKIIYRSAADSVQYHELSNLSMIYGSARRLDSIRALQAAMVSSGAIRMQPVYRANPSFTTYSELSRSGQPNAVTKLTLSDYKGRELPDSLFLCINLEELELVNTRIEKIPRRLSDLPHLKQLTVLNNNPVGKLKLRKNKNIETLIIRGDEHNKLPRHFHAVRQLNTLDLSRNHLTNFPALRNRHLKTLNLSYNELTLSGLKVHSSQRLTNLNLSFNNIKVVPPAISHFKGIVKLNFAANQIEQVEPGIEKLKKLEDLSFYKNQLKDIPDPVYRIPQLQIIDLYFNQIEKIDERISQLKNLQILYLSHNRIYSLPANLGSLTNLHELYLHNNRLGTLPESIGSLKHLKVLRINQNSLLEFPSAIFSLTGLENLDFSNNQIQRFPIEQFQFAHLKILSLVGNPWDADIRPELPHWAQKIREKKTVVHLNAYNDDEEEK